MKIFVVTNKSLICTMYTERYNSFWNWEWHKAQLRGKLLFTKSATSWFARWSIAPVKSILRRRGITK
jgi:hypothetical protein